MKLVLALILALLLSSIATAVHAEDVLIISWTFNINSPDKWVGLMQHSDGKL